MVKKKKRNDDGMVFSTNSSYNFESDFIEGYDWSPSGCTLYVSLDRKQRAGKPVTFVEGHNGPASDLLSLGKDLKKKCGGGGSVKEGCNRN